MNHTQLLADYRTALAGLERRVDRTLDQCRRFDQIAAPLQPWASRWSTATLERLLHLDHLPLGERERALVALALQATAEAGDVIDAYDPTGAGEDHTVFYQVARIEWEQRHQARKQRQPAA